jgi:hypothetical protein
MRFTGQIICSIPVPTKPAYLRTISTYGWVYIKTAVCLRHENKQILHPSHTTLYEGINL